MNNLIPRTNTCPRTQVGNVCNLKFMVSLCVCCNSLSATESSTVSISGCPACPATCCLSAQCLALGLTPSAKLSLERGARHQQGPNKDCLLGKGGIAAPCSGDAPAASTSHSPAAGQSRSAQTSKPVQHTHKACAGRTPTTRQQHLFCLPLFL